MSSDDVNALQIARNDERFFGVRCRAGKYLPVGIGHKRAAPKLDMLLDSSAVGCSYIDTVGDGMSAHDRFPSIGLCRPKFVRFVGQPTDRCRVENDIGSRERRQSRRFGKPLIPTDANADASGRCFETAKNPSRPEQNRTSRNSADRRECASFDTFRPLSRLAQKLPLCCDTSPSRDVSKKEPITTTRLSAAA